MPVHERHVDGAAFLVVVHLPDAVMTIGVTASTPEEVPVQGSSAVGRYAMPTFVGVEGEWMVFVDRLSVQYGLDRLALIVLVGLAIEEPVVVVPILSHVEIQPFICMVEVC